MLSWYESGAHVVSQYNYSEAQLRLLLLSTMCSFLGKSVTGFASQRSLAMPCPLDLNHAKLAIIPCAAVLIKTGNKVQLFVLFCPVVARP